MAEPTASWLYAITAERVALPEAGVAGEQPRTVAAGGLIAVVGTVELAEFGDEALHRRLNDLATLERIARSHHEVVARAAAQTTVLAARLATLMRDDDSVTAMLARREPELRAALARVAGRSEWGVKILPRPEPTPPPAEDDRPGSLAGTRYLLRRRGELATRQQARERAAASAQHAHHTLTRTAVASRRIGTQADSGQAAPLLNVTYLVNDREAATFAATVRDLTERCADLRLQVSGPWPPYSFADIEPEGSDGS